jgi:hypothetical protein
MPDRAAHLNQDAVIGAFRHAHPVERGAVSMTGSFAVTSAAARTINYVRERSRPLPRTRGLARILVHFPQSNAIRVHHFLPGIAIAFGSGAVAIATRAEGWGAWLSVPFGLGVGLITDELRMLVVCAALCALIVRRGRCGTFASGPRDRIG